MPVFVLTEENIFPAPHLARHDGLLAVGGDLSVKRLILAYQMGIFPWYSEKSPILWWSPDPRVVLYPTEIHVPKSLKKIMKKGMFNITADTAFEDVIVSCADVLRKDGRSTWIIDDIIKAYCGLHKAGYAHSIEAWNNGTLVGGLYGVSLGRCFFGESMFTKQSNASKVAFVTLVEYLQKLSFDLIDCQVKTDHLLRFGARGIPRKKFLQQLAQSLKYPTLRGKWQVCFEC